MLPLSMADVGSEYIIQRIGGKDEVRAHLQTMGFVVGAAVTVVSELNGNIIVNVKNTRVAISREESQKIMV